MKRYYSSGPAQGVIMMFIVIIDIVLYLILDFFFPATQIDGVVDFPYQAYRENREKFGDHEFSVFAEKEERSVQKSNGANATSKR
jgi:hypothetical protein